MGQKDLATNKCLSDAERYADLINAVVFNGEQRLHSEELQEVDSKSVISGWLYKYGYKGRQLYRDVVKRAAFGANFAVVGLENQNDVHYLMPLRSMAYDLAEYEKQASKIGKLIRKKKNITSAEFLSRFGKKDRLHPCVTIVLFYGKEWDGSKELYDLIDFTDIPEEMKEYVNNYKVHIVNVSKWENVEMFKTDLKQIFSFLRCANDKEKIKELTDNDPEFQSLDEEAYDMLSEYASSSVLKRLKKKYCKGGKVNMCKGLQDWAAEERLVGMEQGMERGIEVFVQDKLEDGKSKEEIVSKLILRFQIDDVKANNYYQKYGVK